MIDSYLYKFPILYSLPPFFHVSGERKPLQNQTKPAHAKFTKSKNRTKRADINHRVESYKSLVGKNSTSRKDSSHRDGGPHPRNPRESGQSKRMQRPYETELALFYRKMQPNLSHPIGKKHKEISLRPTRHADDKQ